MKFTSVLVGALASVTAAHSDPRDEFAGIPKLMGARKFLAEMKARNALPPAFEAPAPLAQEEKREPAPEVLEERQNVDGQCGPGFGSCAAGICCSPAG